MDCFYCGRYVKYWEKRCENCWVKQDNKFIALFSKDKRWNYVFKKFLNKELWKSILYIICIILMLWFMWFWIYHLVSKWHHMRFCWDWIWDIAWYVTAGFFAYCWICELFFKDWFKEWLKTIWRIIWIIIVIFGILYISGKWDWESFENRKASLMHTVEDLQHDNIEYKEWIASYDCDDEYWEYPVGTKNYRYYSYEELEEEKERLEKENEILVDVYGYYLDYYDIYWCRY